MTKRRIYVASSWRNYAVDSMCAVLRNDGHEVYNFKESGFQWDSVSTDWRTWNLEQYKYALCHENAILGYERDIGALNWCDTLLLVTPSGKSAHLEAGFAAGAGKQCYALMLEKQEAELMYRMFESRRIYGDLANIRNALLLDPLED